MTLWSRRRRRRLTPEKFNDAIRSRIAIFGGTFDPIHKAHLAVAREAVVQFGISSVLFVVAGNPPHKSGATWAGYEHRYRMVELACRDDAFFVASRLEEGDEKSYSIQTIEKVKTVVGSEGKVYFLIGADAFAEIRTWYRWWDVVREVDFIVVTRPGHHFQTPAGATVYRLNVPALPVSSSEIRAKLAAGEAPEELPPPVLDYIREHSLYGYPKPPS